MNGSVIGMPVRFHYDQEGWRPSWGQMLGMVERYCHEDTTSEEEQWLRLHATDWLMALRYMRSRTENHMAETRKYLKEIESVDPVSGRPRDEYLRAKAAADLLTGRRLHWIASLDMQLAEARYILGFEKIDGGRADLVDLLIRVRSMLITGEEIDRAPVLRIIELLIVRHGDGFDPDAYRPGDDEPD